MGYPVASASGDCVAEDLTLADPGALSSVVVEFAERCNLRCVYCHQNLPDFKAQSDIHEMTWEQVLAFIAKHGIRDVNLTGAGETLEAKDWRRMCDDLLVLSENGTRLHMTSNLAKIVDFPDLETLSRFTLLTISVDSVDREQLRNIRRSADIRTIVYNIIGIRAAAIRSGRKPTKIRVSGVLSADIVSSLDWLAGFVVAMGVDEFMFQDLVEYATIPNNVRSVWSLTGLEAMDAVRAIQASIDLIRSNRITYLDTTGIDGKLKALTAAAGQGAEPATDAGSAVMVHPEPGPGETRDCTDPWTFLQVRTDGRLRPCCMTSLHLGQVPQDGNMDDVFNGETARTLRRNLLTGNLDSFCQRCNFRSVTRTDTLRERIRGIVPP